MLRFNYQGLDPNPAYQDTFAYAQIIDSTIGWKVWGNHATPIPVKLDGKNHTVEVPLTATARAVKPGQTLRLQIAPSTAVFAPQRSGVYFTATNIDLKLPVVSATKYM